MDGLSLTRRHFPDVAAPIGRRLGELQLPETAQVRAYLGILRRMSSAGMPARAFTSHFVGLLATFLLELVPAARRGLVPGLSFPGRHTRADRWMADVLARKRPRDGYTVFDIGCGYPPHTSVDLANAWPASKIVAVDPQLPAYLLEHSGVRAFFGRDRTLSYAVSDAALARVNDADTRAALIDAFARASLMLGELRSGEGELDGARFRLVKDPVQDHERENMSFETASIEGFGRRDADYVRCLNVLAYFPEPARTRARSALAQLLLPGGLLLTGSNFIAGSEAHYTVYERRSELKRVEIGFGIDNLRPLGPLPWLELHRDPEVQQLAGYVRAIRSDTAFSQDFDLTFERVTGELGLLDASADDFDIAPLPPTRAHDVLRALLTKLDDLGFVERAAAVLRTRGYDAARNATGDISVAERD